MHYITVNPPYVLVYEDHNMFFCVSFSTINIKLMMVRLRTEIVMLSYNVINIQLNILCLIFFKWKHFRVSLDYTVDIYRTN